MIHTKTFEGKVEVLDGHGTVVEVSRKITSKVWHRLEGLDGIYPNYQGYEILMTMAKHTRCSAAFVAIKDSNDSLSLTEPYPDWQWVNFMITPKDRATIRFEGIVEEIIYDDAFPKRRVDLIIKPKTIVDMPVIRV